jgi:glucans biosynthesis protein
VKRLAVVAAFVGATLSAQPALGFGFDDLAAQARALAAQPYRGAAPPSDARVRKLHYDASRMIRLRAERALWHGESRGFEVQWLHAAAFHPHPVRLHEVADGVERPIDVDAASFDYGRAFAGAPPPRAADVAGFRVVLPQPGGAGRELIAFLGSSYFRAPGPGQGQFGLSARGLAIDTVAPRREEFPRFVAYWFERPAAVAEQLRLYALLDG